MSRFFFPCILILFAILAACQPGREKNVQPALVDSIIPEQLPQTTNEPIFPESNCSYHDTTSSLGMGLISIPQKCKFYNNSRLTDLYMEWDLSQTYDPPKPACALYYKPDYGIAHYVCLDSTDRYYHILINGNQEKYIPRIYGKIFKNWFTYISGSIGGIDLRGMDGRDTVPMMSEPSETAVVIPVNRDLTNGGKSFCPLEMKGDWLKVKPGCYTPDERSYTDCHTDLSKECPDNPMGWVRWRKGNKILIEIHQLL